MGNSFVFVAISVIVFIILFAFLFQLAPILFGAVYNALDAVVATGLIPTAWLVMYVDFQSTIQLLLPLMMSLGIVLIVLKVLMLATNKGAD